MAIELLGASNARLGFGDIAAINGLTGITLSITVNASSLTGPRIFHQWGELSQEEALILQMIDTDELAFAVGECPVGDFNSRYGEKTTGLNLTTATTYRIVARWQPDQVEIWVNGVAATMTAWISNAGVTFVGNSATAVQVGHETDETVDGIDADYSEIAIHGVYMPDSYAYAYGKGVSPKFYRPNGIVYCRAINTGYLIDEWGRNTVTNTAGTNGDHPPVIMPRRRQIIGVPAAAPGGGSVGSGLTTGLKLDRMRLVA